MNAPATHETRLAVIGCGNPIRRDDGAGIEVIRRLTTRFGTADPTVLRLIDAGTSGFEVLYPLRDAQGVVIVDACRSGSDPGAVFRLPARAAQTPTHPGMGLHGLRWDHALYAASRLYGESFLDRIEVFLIEAETLDFGVALSGNVESGVCTVVREITARVEGCDQTRPR